MSRPLAVAWALSLAAPLPAATGPFEIEVAYWASTGRTDFNHNASKADPNLGNPTSELVYDDLESAVIEIAARFSFAEHYAVGGRFGWGGIEDGLLTDDDYLSAQGAAAEGTTVAGAHRFSRTVSDVDEEDLRTLALEISRRITRASDRGRLDVYGGWHRWQEVYVARGVTQVECTDPGDLCAPAGASGFFGEKVISNDFEWDSLWVGLDGSVALGKRFGLAGRVGFSPYATVVSEDVHHLREDLAQDPSFEARADGYGAELEVQLEVALGRAFALGLGYRAWRLSAEDGTLTAYPADAPAGGMPLNDFRSRREGLLLALSWRSAGK